MRRQFYNRWCRLVFLAALLTAPSHVHAQGSSNCNATGQASGDRPAGAFDLELAKRYEKMSRWKEAEQEYVLAGRAGSPCMAMEALAAIERLRIHRPSDDENFDFELGQLYETMHEWKDAEQHYAAVAKDAPWPLRKNAVDGVRRARRHLVIQEFFDWLQRLAGNIAIVLALLFLLVILWRIQKTRSAIQVMPLESSTDPGSKLLLFWLSTARDRLPALVDRVPIKRTGNVMDAVPLIILPGLDNPFPDPAQNLTIGPVTIPLANWIQMVDFPVVRVYGRWSVGETLGVAQARILRRKRLSSYDLRAFLRSTVDSSTPTAQGRDLELFGYDVLIRAIYVRENVPQ